MIFGTVKKESFCQFENFTLKPSSKYILLDCMKNEIRVNSMVYGAAEHSVFNKVVKQISILTSTNIERHAYIIILYYIILYYIILYYIILYYIILYYIILYYIILYYIILYYIILLLYYIILYYNILYYIILHYIILYYHCIIS